MESRFSVLSSIHSVTESTEYHILILKLCIIYVLSMLKYFYVGTSLLHVCVG